MKRFIAIAILFLVLGSGLMAATHDYLIVFLGTQNAGASYKILNPKEARIASLIGELGLQEKFTYNDFYGAVGAHGYRIVAVDLGGSTVVLEKE